MTQLLTTSQKRIAAEVAQERGLSCPTCGSSELVADDEARTGSDGSAEIDMRCADHGRAAELELSYEEAKGRLALDVEGYGPSET